MRCLSIVLRIKSTLPNLIFAAFIHYVQIFVIDGPDYEIVIQVTRYLLKRFYVIHFLVTNFHVFDFFFDYYFL